MNPLIQLKKTTALSFVALGLTCFGLSPTVQALSPPPDGGYPNGNTAEGTSALFNLTTGIQNTAAGEAALFFNTMGSLNTAYGFEALLTNTGTVNTATGWLALLKNSTGFDNTATGADALGKNDTGGVNTANGAFALFSNMSGNGNTADGFVALFNNTGSRNIAVGSGAGVNLTTGDDNIDIGNAGVTAETATIRIGFQKTQTNTFIAGIHGTLVTGEPVCVDGKGQLGVCPAMANNAKGKVYIARSEAMIRQLQKQQKQIENLTAKLKEQAALMQKVSAQLEASKPAPQTVANN